MLFATDAELTFDLLGRAAPYLARLYHLDYDQESGQDEGHFGGSVNASECRPECNHVYELTEDEKPPRSQNVLVTTSVVHLHCGICGYDATPVHLRMAIKLGGLANVACDQTASAELLYRHFQMVSPSRP